MNQEDYWIDVCAFLERIAKAEEKIASVLEKQEAVKRGF